MRTEKVHSFEYRIKEKNEETGEEVAVTKEAEATAVHFDDVNDILAYYEEKGEGEGDGETQLVAAINKMFKDVAIANERAKLTRVPKVPKALKDRRESLSAEDQAKFDDVMSKLGLKL